MSHRIDRKRDILKQFEWDSTQNIDLGCKFKYATYGDHYCKIKNISLPPDVALIGNSHANQFYPGLSEFLLKKNMNLLNIGAGGCPPIFGFDLINDKRSTGPFECYKTNNIYSQILKSSTIKTVYISFHHSIYFSNNFEFKDIWESKKLEKNNYNDFLWGFLRTIRMLEKHGKKVILIYDTPTLGLKQDIRSCFSLRPISYNYSCNLSRSEYGTDFEKYDMLLQIVKEKTSIKIFSTRKYYDDSFPVDKLGVPTYRVNDHLSIAGSMIFSEHY
ncbi:SGNH hydrolase domain-containing protein [Polynucleobacter sp. AP-Feld-500C-C5]|uniref:SGNH hydrolase domain-containing protein n=1 Tax=Polynucleobacter sp. AP-Feld-500C-C5 TaxID=2576924 RepID=UPI001C0D1207